jgi:cytochrome P450
VSPVTEELVRPEELPEVDINSAKFISEPWSVHEIADARGVVRSDRGLEVYTYKGCQQLFTNKALAIGFDEMYRATGFPDGPVFTSAVESINNLEGERHLALRKTFAQFFTPDRVASLRPVIRNIVESLARDAEQATTCDVMALAGRVPSTLFAHLVGAPASDAPFLQHCSEELLKVFLMDAGNHDGVERAYADLSEYVADIISERERAPGDDVVSHLLAAEGEGVIGREDVIYNTTALLRASTDTTMTQIGNTVALLVEHRDIWLGIGAGQVDVGRAVMESVRLRPGAWRILRVAREPGAVLGIEVSAGTCLFGLVPAAHRDPDVFTEPHRFDAEREAPKPTLNWGQGRHFCLGRPVAVIEMEEVVSVLASRWPRMEPVGAIQSTGRPDVDRITELTVEIAGPEA